MNHIILQHMISDQTLSRAFVACTLLILALPILSLPPIFSPPDWGKTLVFRVLLSLEIIITAAIMWFYPRRIRTIPWKKKEAAGFLLLLAVLGLFLLAILFSFDRTFSVWGSPFRSGGVVNFASYIVFAILAFLVLKPKDWNMAWGFATGIAVLASILALVQWQGLFADLFVQTGRPTSSLGNPIMLAMYLLFFVFPALSFGFNASALLKKILYGSLALLFIFVILITQSRSTYLGLAVASSFFALLYPFNKPWQSRVFKGLFCLLAAVGAVLIYFANATPEDKFPEFIQENHTLFGIVKRADVGFFLQDPRFSAWQVAWKSVLERPLLGYGPENFEIAFDRNYDSRLQGIQYIPDTPNSWWDKAHNSFLDIATQAGIPAAFLYFALFGLLLWQLQKIKKRAQENASLIHGIQAALIGYASANLFAFDTSSIYIIFFFLVAYSLFLIHAAGKQEETQKEQKERQSSLSPYKTLGLFSVAFFLLWFNWQYAWRPLQINGNLNRGVLLVKAERCEEGLKFLDKALAESKETFLNSYTRLKYFDILKLCNDQGFIGNMETAQKGYDALKEAAKTWPNHTRTWIFLGQLTNILVEQQGKAGLLSPEQKAEGIATAHSYFETAQQLSPGHLEVYVDWIKTFLIARDFNGASLKAQECIDRNAQFGECWWLKGMSERFMGNETHGLEYRKTAEASGFREEKSPSALLLLAQYFLETQDMGSLALAYEKMLVLQPNNYQVRASLAFTYYQLREFNKAKEHALRVLKDNPSSEAEVKEFLNLLP